MNLIESSRTRTASEGHATVEKTPGTVRGFLLNLSRTETLGGASLCPGLSPCAPLGQKTIGQKTIDRYLGAKRDAR